MIPVASVLLITITHLLLNLLFKAVEFLRETLCLFTCFNDLLSHYSVVLNIINLLLYFLDVDVLSLLSKNLIVLFSFGYLGPSVRIPNQCMSLGLNWRFELVFDSVNTLLLFFGSNSFLYILIYSFNIRLTFLLDLSHVLFGKNSTKFFVNLLYVNVVTTRFTIRFDKLLLLRIRLCDLLLRLLDRDLELAFPEELGQTLW